MAKQQPETLSSGVKALVKAVPTYMVDKMTAAIKDPPIPKQFIEAKGREEENPFDPTYLKAVDNANSERGRVAMEAMIMYGVELVDGIPPLEEWLPKLQWMAKRSELDLDEYDLDDPLDLEFVYKAFVAVGGVDLMRVTIKSGMQNEEVELAMRGFRGLQESGANTNGEPEPSSAPRDTD